MCSALLIFTRESVAQRDDVGCIAVAHDHAARGIAAGRRLVCCRDQRLTSVYHGSFGMQQYSRIERDVDLHERREARTRLGDRIDGANRLALVARAPMVAIRS